MDGGWWWCVFGFGEWVEGDCPGVGRRGLCQEVDASLSGLCFSVGGVDLVAGLWYSFQVEGVDVQEVGVGFPGLCCGEEDLVGGKEGGGMDVVKVGEGVSCFFPSGFGLVWSLFCLFGCPEDELPVSLFVDECGEGGCVGCECDDGM